MRRLLSYLGASLVLVAPALGAAGARPGNSEVQAALGAEVGRAALVDPQVQAALRALAPGETMNVIVKLRDQAGLKTITGRDRAARIKAVIQALQAKADSSQRDLRVLLEVRRRQGAVKDYVPLWITNSFAVTATGNVIRELAARPEALSITLDATIQEPTLAAPSLADPTPPEANLALINAPALWQLGFHGQGVVVASMDTGVDANHPDLAAQWRGGNNSWFDPNGQHPSTPTDVSGHGTWTMGVIVARDTGGTDIGVAPDARWIAAKIFDDRGSATVSRIHQGFQWLLDPDGDPTTPDAPNVVNNSWGFQDSGCNLEFQLDVQALRAAGIATVFAAGNSGPSAASDLSPANYPESLAVGATDNVDTLYPYSSRGPSACGETQTTYPDLVAPGVSVRTTDLYGAYFSPSGTSLAAPHIAGAMALLLGAFPNLTPAQLEAALERTAVDLGTPGPDDDYGYGRVDVLAAYQLLAAESGTATPTPTPTPTPALLGDVNCDGAVTMADSLLAARLVVGLIPSAPCPQYADVNRDGQVTMTDALLVARVVVGLILGFP